MRALAEVHVSVNDYHLHKNVDPNLRSGTRPISHKGMHTYERLARV